MGQITNGGGNASVKNCTFSGTVSATAQNTNGSATAEGIAVNMTDIASVAMSNANPPIIENCTVLTGTSITASATALEVAGDVLGQMVGGKVTSCTSNANVTAKTWAGGIVGLASSSSTSNTYTEDNLSNSTWPNQYNQAGNDSTSNTTAAANSFRRCIFITTNSSDFTSFSSRKFATESDNLSSSL